MIISGLISYQHATAISLDNKNLFVVCDGKDSTHQNINITATTFTNQIIIQKEFGVEVLRNNLKVKKTKNHKEDGIQWWLYEFNNNDGHTLAAFQISEDWAAVKPLSFSKGTLNNCWVSYSESI